MRKFSSFFSIITNLQVENKILIFYDIILFKSGDDMELIFEKVLERDIDLLMINKFITDDNILNLFLEKIGKSDYKVFTLKDLLPFGFGPSTLS